MKKKRLKLGVMFLLGLGLTGLHAQEAIPAAGGDAAGNGGSASYSVGQVVYTTNIGTNGSSAQGIQQPYVISVVSSIEQAKGITLEYSVYPNPTKDFLVLKVKNYNNENLLYQLVDINGKLSVKQKTEGEITTFSLGNLPNGVYFLKITDNQKEVKTFKIIKN